MVRNEADIVEAFVRHNLRVLDAMLVVDHGSTDATPMSCATDCATACALASPVRYCTLVIGSFVEPLVGVPMVNPFAWSAVDSWPAAPLA